MYQVIGHPSHLAYQKFGRRAYQKIGHLAYQKMDRRAYQKMDRRQTYQKICYPSRVAMLNGNQQTMAQH
jgi:hypothetical protein